MNQQIATALTQGLLAGYGGQTKFDTVKRGNFELKSSAYGDNYIDQWTNGGGQELVRVDGQEYTRVYAGGSVDDSPEIISKLIYFIKTLQDKTRLTTNCNFSEGDWSYQYQIIYQDQNLDITVGKETIRHFDQVVFVHIFILSSVSK